MGGRPSERYDAICFFNSNDRAAVRQIVDSLRERKLSVWLDETELSPTTPVDAGIDEALKASRVAMVCVGRTGLGKYQEWENAGAFNRAVHHGLQLMTVLLPGVGREALPELPFTLTRTRPVEFKASPTEQAALDDIEWGITGKKPKEPSPPLLQEVQHAATAQPESVGPVQQLASELLRNGTTFFLGRRAALGSPGLPSFPSDITVRLAKDLGLFRLTGEHLLPAPDTIGELFATEYGIARLEEAMLSPDEAPANVPALHNCLASVIGTLQNRGKARSARKANPQLIVTTSFDTLIECALLRQRMPFTRVVQSASQPKLYLNEFKDLPDHLDFSNPRACENFVLAQPQKEFGIGGIDAAEIDAIVNLNLENRPEPVLYKYHGSQDIPNTSAMCTGQYYDLNRMQRVIPRRIREIAINTSSTFIGFGMLDCDFQHLYNTILRDGFDQRRDLLRFLIVEKPSAASSCVYNEMELRVWNNLVQQILKRTGIMVVDRPPAAFLATLNGLVLRP